jgi:hypothetical protein
MKSYMPRRSAAVSGSSCIGHLLQGGELLVAYYRVRPQARWSGFKFGNLFAAA